MRILSIGCIFLAISSILDLMHVPAKTEQQPCSDLIRGTIVVVVSTREGFVLVGDSRVTHSDRTHQDNYQKVFKLGNRTACVIAGVVGSEIGVAGFRLRDAIATRLKLLDDPLSGGNVLVEAGEVAKSFEGGFDGVVGLLEPGTTSIAGTVAAISAVSISPEGYPSWITFYLPVEAKFDTQGGMYLVSGRPINQYHSLELGLRFDVQALGFPNVVHSLLRADAPSGDRYSSSKIMKKFYRLKTKGHLDRFSLKDAVVLAKLLAEATMALAPPEAGVGGPIDVVTVTSKGVTWVQQKTEVAEVPQPFRARFMNSRFEGSNQILDGLECLRCTFRNMKLYYNGTADLELIGSKFEGDCHLVLGRDARRKEPEVVRRLLDVLPTTCSVVDE